MRKVTLTYNGHMVLLGHQALEQSKALQANGREQADGQVAPFHANVNDLPDATTGAGLMASTRVATPDGPRRMDELSSGDTVLDANGDTATVLHVLTAPAPRDVYLVRAPYFGLDHDAVLGPNQRIVVTSDTAEYLFGEETVMVPVWALCDARKVQHFETRSSDLLYQVQLDTAAPLKIGKCAVAAVHKAGATKGRVLSDQEARCFAAEHSLGFSN